eukprot:scaffold2366_cov115-Cylindrotheca_fusiformis.AAC.20
MFSQELTHRPLQFLWDEYTWAGSVFYGMDGETDDEKDVNFASFGMGAAINCMLPLVNVEDYGTHDELYFTDNIGLDNAGVSSQSPGVGAFTPFHNRTFEAMRDIPAGQELFVSYGETYFASRPKYYMVPLSEDYDVADSIIQKFQNLTQRLPHVSSTFVDDLWQITRDPDIWQSRPFYALPSNYTKATNSLNNGGTAMLHYNESIRSLDWLEENGECADNIYAHVSTIPHAGRGAFARRFIGKGEVVSPAPLIHLPNRNVMKMYDGMVAKDPDEGSEDVLLRDTTKEYHEQLLLNYCFGHRDSTLLLCPYGLLSSLINHSHEAPNTKIVWSQKRSLISHPEWMNQTVDEWGEKASTGLSFDFVALRDIKETEEILIDYGVEWENAWKQHVREFRIEREHYIPAFELNSIADLRVYTVNEYDYVSDGVLVFCRRVHILMAGIDIEEADDWEGYRSDPYPRLGIYPCRVLERNHDDSYTVELTPQADTSSPSEEDGEERGVSYVLFDVPRDIFYFRDEPMERDHHQSWAFRHDMRIPDEMFPDIWRNLQKEEEDKDDAATENDSDVSNDVESETEL